MYNANSQTKFETTMLKSALREYSDAYIFAQGTISVTNIAAKAAAASNISKKNNI